MTAPLPAKPTTIEGYNALSPEDKNYWFPNGVHLDYGPYRNEGKRGFDFDPLKDRWSL